MNGNLLRNCMWYEDITIEQLAEVLKISKETLVKKIFQDLEFTESEILTIKAFLGLSLDEVFTIFYTDGM